MKTGRFFAVTVMWVLSCSISFGYSDGDGTAGNPYQIADVNDLLELAGDTGNYDKCFLVTHDIDLAGKTFITAIIACDTNLSSSSFQGTAFTGSFDGNNKKIINLKIDTAGVRNDFLGLFGQINGSTAKVKNLDIENAVIVSVASSWFIGGICGENCYGTISNCYTSGSITGGDSSSYLGGLCGYNHSGIISKCHASGSVAGGTSSGSLGGLCGKNYYGTINNCYISSSITGGDSSSYLGGLCGYNHSGIISKCHASGSVAGGTSSGDHGGLCGYNCGMISNCYATGQVTGGDGSNYLGGLCGENHYSGTISNCYSTGSVFGIDFLGGLCGYNSYGTISNSYATGSIHGEVSSWYVGGLCGYNDSGTISSCYFYLFCGPDNRLGTALETEQMNEQGSFAGFDFADNPEDGTENHWVITAGHCPKLSWQTEDGSPPPSYVPITSLSGTGHADEPFQINNMTDFTEFITNQKLNCGYYIFTCDIDLSGQSFTMAVINRYFGGYLNGGGHRIANITINTLGANTDYLGVFGRLCGSICNLRIENILIIGGTGSYYFGGLCGYNYSGIISNCYITGSITGGASSYELGGLCGKNSGTISNCYANGFVTGGNNSAYLGGLCGWNSDGTISNCYANGQIIGGTDSYSLGGLCGYNYYGVIIQCYANSSIAGNNRLGGLCGVNHSGTFNNCYATGSVTGNSNKGGLCGLNTGSVTGCFWDTLTSGTSNGVGNMDPDPVGAIGKTTTEMKTLSVFTSVGWDFTNETANGTNDYWRMCVNRVDYPRLNWESIAGDFACPDGVSTEDLDYFVGRWLLNNCSLGNKYCGGVDVDASGTVDLGDFAVLAGHWLEGI